MVHCATLDRTETNECGDRGYDEAHVAVGADADAAPETWVAAFEVEEEHCKADFVPLHPSEESQEVVEADQDTGADANADEHADDGDCDNVVAVVAAVENRDTTVAVVGVYFAVARAFVAATAGANPRHGRMETGIT